MVYKAKLVPVPVKVWVCASGDKIVLGITRDAAVSAWVEQFGGGAFGSPTRQVSTFEETVWSFDPVGPVEIVPASHPPRLVSDT